MTADNKGLLTVIGAFVICPCHLPVTLGLLAFALSGTVAGAFLHDHLVLAGAVITIGWIALMARGFWLMRQGRSCPVPR